MLLCLCGSYGTDSTENGGGGNGVVLRAGNMKVKHCYRFRQSLEALTM